MSDYETHHSHTHCWQNENPPCGLKGEHRCCLCGTPPTTPKIQYIDLVTDYLNVSIKEYEQMKADGILMKVKEVEEAVTTAKQEMLAGIPLDAIKRLCTPPSNTMNLVYTLPAQVMRNAADAMEQKDQDYTTVTSWIHRIESILGDKA